MCLNSQITFILFDLHGALIDPARLMPCAAHRLGDVMAARYGGTASQWTAAYERIRADWDSYHADLDFDGDEPLSQVYEGLYRVTRALFRLTQTAQPSRETLQTLSRELPALMSRECDAVRADMHPILTVLAGRGCRLGVTSHLLDSQTRALLQGGAVDHWFDAVFGVDTLEQFRRDTLYYQRVAVRSGVPVAQCLVIDRSLSHLEAARSAGMQAESPDTLEARLNQPPSL